MGGSRRCAACGMRVGAGNSSASSAPTARARAGTLRAILGVVKPSAGQVAFDGEDVTGQPSHRMVTRGLALVPEGRLVFADQSVRDNLVLGAYSRIGKDPHGVAEDIERAVTMFPRLGERIDQSAGTLSGGEQQMLAIARGLLSRPRLVIADELSLGLRPRSDMLFRADRAERQGPLHPAGGADGQLRVFGHAPHPCDGERAGALRKARQ